MSSPIPLAMVPGAVHVQPGPAHPGDLSRIGRRLTEIASGLTSGRIGPGLASCKVASWSLAHPLTLLLDVKGGDIVACNLQFGRGAWWALADLADELARIARAAWDPRSPRERGWMTRRVDRASLACFATTFDDAEGRPSHVLVTVVEGPPEVSAPTRLLVDTRLPMWAVDRRTLRLLDVNDATVRAYGYSRQRMLDMRLTDLMTGDRSKLVAPIAEWSGAEDLRWEGTHRCADGELAHVELIMRASEDAGAPIAFVLGHVSPGISGTWSTSRIA